MSLSKPFYTAEYWEQYPFTRVNNFSGIVVDASLVTKDNVAISLTGLITTGAHSAPTYPGFSFLVNGAPLQIESEYEITPSVWVPTPGYEVVDFGDYRTVKFNLAGLTASFVLTISKIVQLLGEDELFTSRVLSSSGSSITSVTKQDVTSTDTIVPAPGRQFKVLTGPGLSVAIVDGSIQVSRTDETPCPTACPTTPILSINNEIVGVRNINFFGNCHTIEGIDATHEVWWRNQCAPCCDCDEQSKEIELLAKLYAMYNQTVVSLQHLQGKYMFLRQSLLNGATAQNNCEQIAKVQYFLPNDIFIGK